METANCTRTLNAPSRDADPADPTAAQPDPTHDRHEAVPTR